MEEPTDTAKTNARPTNATTVHRSNRRVIPIIEVTIGPPSERVQPPKQSLQFAPGRGRAVDAACRLLGAQVAIGAAAIFARFALAGAGPIVVAALRLAIATLIVFALARRVERLATRREVAFAVAGLALALHLAVWFASLRYTSVAIATLLVTTTPLWTELYDVAVRRRTPSRAFFLALASASGGVALIALRGTSTPAPVPGHAALGATLALVGSVAIGAYLLIVRDAGRTSEHVRLGTRQIVARTYGWATLALAAAAWFAHETPPPPDARTAWAGILAMALISQLLGHTLLNAALASFAPSTVALTTLLEPVVAALLAAALFREALAPTTVAGGLLVLLAVAVTLATSRDAAQSRT